MRKLGVKTGILTSIAAAVLLAFSYAQPVLADEDYGDYYYVTDYEEGTVTITGYAGTDTEIEIPSEIREFPVTKIWSSAFNHSNLKKVTVPDSVVSIDKWAFSFSEKLEEVVLPEEMEEIGEKTFYGCKNLKDITLPDKLVSIGEKAFYECGALKEITLPDGLKTVDKQVFMYCNGLEKVVLPETVTTIDEEAFYCCGSLKSVNIPEGVTALGDSAFFCCVSLEEITIPDSVTDLGVRTFLGCERLKEIRIPDSVTELGDGVFDGCIGLESIEISEKVVSIGEGAFAGCSGLKKLEIPAGVQEIGKGAFSGCIGLESIEISGKVVAIGESAFADCSGLKKLEIPASVQEIGEGAFSGCSGLTEIVLPDGLKSIEARFCSGCSNLKKVIFPDSVESIGDYAFYECPALMEVTIPDSVRSIGDSTFFECTALMKITIPAGVQEIGNDAFDPEIMICGYVGSAAQTYASENKLNFIDISKGVCEHNYTLASGSGGNGKQSYKCTKCGTSYSIYKLGKNAYESNNKGYRYGYYTYAYQAIESDLAAVSDGFMRVEAAGNEYVAVEYYNDRLELKECYGIPMELPIYGGFYAGEDAYYLVFGQANPDESDSVEVIRIVKYSKAWERLGSDSLYGANTKDPFHAGSLRMCELDGILYIKTAHRMFKSSDGLNHQANMVILFEEEYMQIAQAYYKVENYRYGYVSHSFNQFITAGKNGIATVDHGDAYPRSVVLNEADSYGREDWYRQEDVLEIPDTDKKHYNYTFTTVGGFAASDSNYLVAGSAVRFDKNYENNEIYNIYVGVAPLDVEEEHRVDVKWLTDNAEGASYSMGMPHLVELDKHNYALIWAKRERTSRGGFEDTGKICIALIDGSGNLRCGIQEADGALSDCRPIYGNGKITWYVTENSAPKFYRLTVSWNGDKAAGVSGSGAQAPVTGGDNGGAAGQTGLFAADGIWAYYKNGAMKSSYTGMVHDEKLGWWYVTKGVVDFAYNGYASYGGSWWAVAGGRVYPEYTGLWGTDAQGWWYAENGRINFDYNGFVPFGGSWWAVAGGRVYPEYTGLWGNDAQGWWYAENGRINLDYNGFAEFAGEWWAVAGGSVRFDYTGQWGNDVQGRWYVENGKINFQKTGDEDKDMVKIKVGDTVLTAKLADNSSAEAFRELLAEKPLTVSMSDYGNFEKVGPIGSTLPRNDEKITTEPGDIILYLGTRITIYYDKNTWDFTRLGKIQNVTQEELKKILGDKDVEVTFSLP